MSSSSGRRLAYLGAIAIGIAIRILEFAKCRSLGLDESRLAINIAHRSYQGLLRPLDLDQSAPPLFLWAERMVLVSAGYAPCVLRLVPMLAGIAAALLVYPLAKRYLLDDEARLAGLIGVFCPLLITYSNTVKQYAFELLVATVLLLMLDRAIRSSLPGQWFLIVVAAGVLSPWLSLSSVFMLAAGWIVLVGKARRDRITRWWLAPVTVLWAISAVTVYGAVYRPANQNPYMRHFWELAFLQPGRSDFLVHLWKSLEDLVWGFVAGDPLIDRRPFLPLLHIGTALVLTVIALGGRRLVRAYGVSALWLLGGPAAMAFGASIAGLYPVSPRLTLFMLPGLIVLFVAGASASLHSAGKGVARHRLAIATGLVVLPMEFQAIVRTVATEPSGHFQQVVEALRENRRPGEPVYIFARSLPAWIYYSTDWARPDSTRVRYLIDAAGSGGFAFENRASRGRVSAAELAAARPTPAAPGELLGLPSGMEWREVEEHRRTEPDSGWIEAERRRIEGAANPGIWILATTYYAAETELFRRLEHDARRRTFARLEPGSALVRYEFTPLGTDSSDVQNESRSLGRLRSSAVAGK